MERRQLLKQSAFAIAAFTFSRDVFANVSSVPFDTSNNMIRLGSNENPHGPSILAKEAMIQAVSISNRYQWDMNGLLRTTIASMTGHTKDHVALGAGSSELLGIVSLWAAYKKGNVVASDPTFKLWMPAARRMGLPIKLVPLTPSKHNDLKGMADAIDEQTKMVYLCNPNNPTGTVSPTNELEEFIKKVASTTIVLLDEAYTDYYDTPSMSKLIDTYPNLIIAKTFSKTFGMAGARVGYVLAHPSTIKQLNEFQAWANAGPSAVSMQGALAAIKDTEFVAFCKKENIKAKSILYNGFNDLGIVYINSYTSFVYFDTSTYKKDIPALLLEHQIIGARSFEQNSSWLRISIGTVDEMQKVVAVLKSGV
ncbi:MAG: pyridoxal phosphate-dependent aminotransferase [Sediminibacterium sp.]